MIKYTGLTRKIDNLGRIVIPIGLRKRLNIEPNDSIEIFTDNNTIIFKKYQRKCTFCESTRFLKDFNNNLICKNCLNKIYNIKIK